MGICEMCGVGKVGLECESVSVDRKWKGLVLLLKGGGFFGGVVINLLI